MTMSEFYDHPETGKLHLRAAAGGTGGGATSVYDAPARKEDFAIHPQAHAAYLRRKHAAAAAEAVSEQRDAALHKVEEVVAAVNEVVSEEENKQES